MSQSSDNAIRVVTDDKTHFPLLEIQEIGSLTLWPITKIQFEMFISQVNRYGDTWYDEILLCNPRISYQNVSKKNYERLFITGLHIEEALSFSKWFGEDFRIPTVEEWRTIYRILDSNNNLFTPPKMSYPANTIWKKLTKITNSQIKFSMMTEGVVEWVMQGDDFVGIGAPCHAFYPTAWNPLRDLVTQFKRDERLNYFGLRLIKGIDHE